jgi:acetyl-CoA acetyltransferase
MIRERSCDIVAIVGGDAVASMPTETFLRRAEEGWSGSSVGASIPSPVIVNGYDRVAQWQIKEKGLTREQLAMVPVLMSRNACKHELAMTKTPHTLKKVLEAPQVASATSLLECARRADGAAAVVLASEQFLRRHDFDVNSFPAILSGGEASGPLHPPVSISEDDFSCHVAMKQAYERSKLTVNDIDFFGLYDCFPICFIRAVEACGLAPEGQGGAWVQSHYELSERQNQMLSPDQFPVNTHGGLMCFGAPWEVPAMYNIIEAFHQLKGQAGNRQVSGAKRAIVYGNGGIFSASSVAILGMT